MSGIVSVESCLLMQMERTDQIIIEGEKRICRLTVLAEAMFQRGYDIGGIETLKI